MPKCRPLAFSTLALLLACHDGPTLSPVLTVTAALDDVQLMIGESDTLSAVVTDESGRILVAGSLSWSSSDPAVASVTAGGVLTGVGSGNARIRVEFGAAADSVAVVVTREVTMTAEVGPVGGSVTLPSGTQVTIPGGALTAVGAVTLVETPPNDSTLLGDPASRLTIQLPPARAGDLIPLQVTWPLRGAPTPGTEIVFVVEQDGVEPSYGLPLPTGSLGVNTSPRSNPGASVTPDQAPATSPTTFLAYGVGVGHARTTFAVHPKALLFQTPQVCASAYEVAEALRPSPLSPPVTPPDVAILLLHGWQMSMRCLGSVEDPDHHLTDFDDFYPLLKTWPELIADIWADPVLNSRVRVYSLRYPSTLTPQETGAELWARLEDAGLPAQPGHLLVVGHSMGGLVARTMDELDSSRRVGGIVTLGTPHLGAGLADSRVARLLVPSPGLTSLGPGVYDGRYPLPTTARMHAVRGDIPCSLLQSVAIIVADWLEWKVVEAVVEGSCRLWPNSTIGQNDGLVSHESACPVTLPVGDCFIAPQPGEAVSHLALPSEPKVRAETIAKLREYLPPAPAPADAPTIAVSSTSLTFSALTSDPAGESVTITNSGTGALTGLSVAILYSAGQPTGWLGATLSSPSAPATVRVEPHVLGLSQGTHTATVLLNSTAPGVTNSPIAIDVTLDLVAQPITVASVNGEVGRLTVSGGDIYYFATPPFDYSRLERVPASGGAPTILATRVWQPFGLHTDGTHVYWGEARSTPTPGLILRVGVNGGAVDTLAIVDSLNWDSHYTPFSVDSTHIYFATVRVLTTGAVGVIQRVAKSGGMPDVVVTTSIYPAFTMNGGSLFFEQKAAMYDSVGVLARVPVSGGLPTTVAFGAPLTYGGNSLLAAGDTLYLVSGGTLSSVPASGGALVTRSALQSPSFAPYADGGFIWLLSGNLGDPLSEILRFRLSDFSRTVLHQDFCGPYLAVDSASVYWPGCSEILKISR